MFWGCVFARNIFFIKVCFDGYSVINLHLGGRVNVVVKALVSHQCGPGSIPRLNVICGLGLLLVLFSALLKNQHFQIPIPSGCRTSLETTLVSGASWVNIMIFIYYYCHYYNFCNMRALTEAVKDDVQSILRSLSTHCL